MSLLERSRPRRHARPSPPPLAAAPRALERARRVRHPDRDRARLGHPSRRARAGLRALALLPPSSPTAPAPPTPCSRPTSCERRGARVVAAADVDRALRGSSSSTPQRGRTSATPALARDELLERALAPDLTYQRAGELPARRLRSALLRHLLLRSRRRGPLVPALRPPGALRRRARRRRRAATAASSTATPPSLGQWIGDAMQGLRPGRDPPRGLRPTAWSRCRSGGAAGELGRATARRAEPTPRAPDGFILAVGDGIRPGVGAAGRLGPRRRAHDPLPLGLPVARDMEGRVLTEMLDDDFARAHPVTFIPSYESLAVTPVPGRRRPLPGPGRRGRDPVSDGSSSSTSTGRFSRPAASRRGPWPRRSSQDFGTAGAAEAYDYSGQDRSADRARAHARRGHLRRARSIGAHERGPGRLPGASRRAPATRARARQARSGRRWCDALAADARVTLGPAHRQPRALRAERSSRPSGSTGTFPFGAYGSDHEDRYRLPVGGRGAGPGRTPGTAFAGEERRHRRRLDPRRPLRPEPRGAGGGGGHGQDRLASAWPSSSPTLSSTT